MGVASRERTDTADAVMGDLDITYSAPPSPAVPSSPIALHTASGTHAANKDGGLTQDLNEHALRSHQSRMSSALACLPAKKDDDYSISMVATGPSSTAIVPFGPSEDGPRNGRSRNPFTGLSNQGATCYMNSLLQTLYMTPEFRQGLFKWKFLAPSAADGEEEDEEYNIPFQLQMLFARLQLTTQEHISTKALTKSFGWTGADVFQQHDVQELCRVLFDALENSFKGTVNENLVNDLYQGSLKDFVHCKTCGYESSRIDNFLDLSLVIRPFGSERLMHSVEEAIEFFLKPELLSNENQWMCDQCQQKRDAIKGLKFSKLPYLLSLQLKRFDFDYATFNRIKLHSEVTFPKYLNMNPYLSDDAATGEKSKGTIARKMSMERHELEGRVADAGTAGASTAGSGGPHRMSRLSSMDESKASMFENGSGQVDVKDMDTWDPAFDPLQFVQHAGPYVYELFSVMIHSGSALGGHYYAYIKSVENGKWYNFNDSTVSLISEMEVKKAFGGTNGNYARHSSYSTCAYMLMYRLVSPERNVNCIAKESIPAYLTDRMAAEEAQRHREEQERLEMAKKMVLKIHMKGAKAKPVDKTVHVYRTSTIAELLKIACKLFEDEPGVYVPTNRRNIRLRAYNEYLGLLTDTYDKDPDISLTRAGIYPSKHLFVETKRDDEEWEDYDQLKLQLFVGRFNAPRQPEDGTAGHDDSSEDVDEPTCCIQIDGKATLSDLEELVKTRFRLQSNKPLRFVQKVALNYGGAKVLNKAEDEHWRALTLKPNLDLSNGNTVLFEECEDLSSPSPALEYFVRQANMISVNYKYLDRAAVAIRIDRRETVRKLKGMIGAQLGLSPERFKILRGINSAGIEIKAIDSTLCKLSIGANHTLFVLEGTPLRPGEYNFRLMLYQPGKRREPPSAASNGQTQRLDIDELLYHSNRHDADFTFVSHVIISEEMTVEAIRERVLSILMKKELIDSSVVNGSHLRLRDYQNNRMLRILMDGKRLCEASKLAAYEGRTIVAQVIDEPDPCDEEHLVVNFVYFDRSRVRFCKQRRGELLIPASLSRVAALQLLASKASAALGGVAEQQLRFTQVPAYRDCIDVLEASNMMFQISTSLSGLDEERLEPILVVDTAVEPHELSREEQEAIREQLSQASDARLQEQKAKYMPLPASSSSTSRTYYSKPKESALVIRTKSKASKGGGGSSASSGSRQNGVSIRTPGHTPTHKANGAPRGGSATDEEEDDDRRALDMVDSEMDLYA